MNPGFKANILKYWHEIEEKLQTQLIYIYYVVLFLMEIN